jgi:hypothetical protein
MSTAYGDTQKKAHHHVRETEGLDGGAIKRDVWGHIECYLGQGTPYLSPYSARRSSHGTGKGDDSSITPHDKAVSHSAATPLLYYLASTLRIPPSVGRFKI